MYLKIIPLVGINQYASNIATLPADAPSGIYEVAFTGSNPSYMYTIRAYNQGVGSNRPQTIQQLESANQPLIANGNYPDVSFWSYESETGTSTLGINSGSNVVRASCFVHHVLGEETKLVELSSNGQFTQDQTITNVVVRQIA